MPSNFDLIITVDTPNHSAEFNLLDENGVQLAFRQTDFKTIELSHKRGLFDLRNYLRHYVVEGQEEASVADIGVCIAEPDRAIPQRRFVEMDSPGVPRIARLRVAAADTGRSR
jgi:hypothetical protein